MERAKTVIIGPPFVQRLELHPGRHVHVRDHRRRAWTLSF
jgi:hypothetical protein